MTVMEKSQLLSFLEERSQEEWLAALNELVPAIHPVDRLATRVWFAFWPLELREALLAPEGAEELARLMDLEGNWKLEEQIDASVSILFGAHYWTGVKAVLLSETDADGPSLVATLRRVAKRAAESEKVDEALTLGISAVGLMILRQVGLEALERVKGKPAEGLLLPKNPEKVLAERERGSGGILSFIKGVNRTWDVRWEERQRRAVYQAINGQDLAMAGSSDKRDYRGVDYRRIDGPVPVECRVGSCGYCWVGILSGRETLSAITDFERQRLRYFGYDTVNEEEESHPPVRLACQAQCHGDVTLTVSPWNGELSRRHDAGRKKLGTA
jgi:ferredoxin